ncbi:MAG TPA: DUF3562 domain-containing protein [Steroidobacteraceae bacterium]|jgi:hypothetical protein|nr:DUF3562 domain-containing protein [Steroidobacteraceae bacterium]
MNTSDAAILAQEHRAIERLAHDTHTSVAKVQQVFLSEYAKLATDAYIRSFLPLLVANRVRALLHGRRAVPMALPH